MKVSKPGRVREREVEPLARELRERVQRWVGIPTCVGIAPTKTLAKVANFIAKKRPQYRGVCDLRSSQVRAELLCTVPVDEVWGIGAASAAKLAKIGVETAAYYPSLTLSASGGFESSTLKHWFDWPSRFWSIGPTFSETVYDAGLRRATIQQYTATYNADVASYRQTVLTAFQQVEDYLAQVRVLSEQIEKQREATAAAQTYADLAQDRFRTGLDPFLDVITAQTTLLADQQNLVSLEMQQMTAAVNLVEALGGGWDRTDLPTPAQVSAKPSKADSAKVP